MKHPVAALLCLATCALSSLAQEPRETVTKDDVLKAIRIFRAEPVSAQGTVMAAVIVRFAKESPAVQVAASPTLIPWMEIKPLPKQSNILLAAYIAGSVRSQLESGKTKNDPVAGEKQVLETYQKLQQTDPDLHIDAVEKLIALQKQRKLEDYVESK